MHGVVHSMWSADILIYGCNLAESDTGEQFVKTLAQLSGTDVAASDDITGHALLGGDWDLEYRVGNVETQTIVSSELQQSYQSILATETVSDDFSSGDFTGNTGSQSWVGDWIEVDAGGAGCLPGNVVVTGGELRIRYDWDQVLRVKLIFQGQVQRHSVLIIAQVPVLTPLIRIPMVVEVSNDGGTTWFLLEDINYLTGVNAGSKSYDISGYAAVDTQIRFRANAGYGGPVIISMLIMYRLSTPQTFAVQ